MKKKIVVLAVILCSFFIVIGNTDSAYAWGPISHCGLTEKAILELTDANARELITGAAYSGYFWCGLMFPDITVLRYYTTWAKYENTHTWNFFQNLWQRASIDGSKEAKAFALGIGTHLIQDTVVHNSYIPSKIAQYYFFQNNIVHPLVEMNMEGKFATEGDLWYIAAATARAKTAFGIVNSNFTDSSIVRYTPLSYAMIQIGRQDSEIEGYANDANTFKNILSGDPLKSGTNFYTTGYTVSGEFWGIYQAVAGIVRFFVDASDAQVYYDNTIRVTKTWWNSGNFENPQNYVTGLDPNPTGLKGINAANQMTLLWNFLLFAPIFSVIGYVMWRKRSNIKKRVQGINLNFRQQ